MPDNTLTGPLAEKTAVSLASAKPDTDVMQAPLQADLPAEPKAALVYHIRPLRVDDRNWVADWMDKHWHSTKIVSRGQVHYGHLLPGFAAFPGTQEAPTGKAIGLLTYRIDGDACEIVTLDSDVERSGIGTALIDTLKMAATEAGYKRLWLITTNDNIEAIRFYQRRGFRLSALYIDALSESRRHKPQIPIIGKHDIPLRDEIEFTLMLHEQKK